MRSLPSTEQGTTADGRSGTYVFLGLGHPAVEPMEYWSVKPAATARAVGGGAMVNG